MQRHKEDADEYRYFPDPDLVPLEVDPAWVETIREGMPELPHHRELRYISDLGLGEEDARAIVDEPRLTKFFESVIATGAVATRVAAVLRNVGARLANDRGCGVHELGITPAQVHAILEMSASDKLGSSSADKLFALCCDHPDRDAESLAAEHGLLQVSDTGALSGYVDQVLADERNARAVADIRAGKDKAIGALLGQVMKLSKGQANPKMVTDLIRQKIS